MEDMCKVSFIIGYIYLNSDMFPGFPKQHIKKTVKRKLIYISFTL